MLISVLEYLLMEEIDGKSQKNDWFQLWMWKPESMKKKKSLFLIKIHVCQYLNKMGEFLKVMELKYSLSRQLTDCKANIMNVPKEPEMVQLV